MIWTAGNLYVPSDKYNNRMPIHFRHDDQSSAVVIITRGIISMLASVDETIYKKSRSIPFMKQDTFYMHAQYNKTDAIDRGF